jgi:dynein heavy chain
MVLSAVCILLQEKSDWESAKKVIVEMSFLERLKGYDKTSITDGLIKKLRTVTSN